MNNNLLQIKIRQRLNKLSSFDYDNIECWMIQEAFNKAQIEWVRRRLHGLNALRESSEQSVTVVDDLQILLSEINLRGIESPKYFETDIIPANYLHFVRISAKAKTDCCPPRTFSSIYQAEEANVDMLLGDNFKQPSFEWAETFCTILGDKVRIYTDGKFNIVDPKLVYYRKPKDIQILGCTNISTGRTFTTNVECELKDDICEILVDEAAAILAGDIESMNQYQRETQNAQRNS
jgi:hypothetical protein